MNPCGSGKTWLLHLGITTLVLVGGVGGILLQKNNKYISVFIH